MQKAKYLDETELQMLTKVLKEPQDERLSLRNRAMLLLLLSTGCRAQELLNTCLSDVSLNSSSPSVFIHGLKGSNNRQLPLSEELASLLKTYIESDVFRGNFSKEKDKLFPISYDGLIYVWYRIRPFKKKLHSLRHTFAIELYKRTRDVRLVQYALGHKSIANTEVYQQYVYNQEELRKAFDLDIGSSSNDDRKRA